MDFILKIPQDGQYGAPEFLFRALVREFGAGRVGDHQSDVHAGPSRSTTFILS